MNPPLWIEPFGGAMRQPLGRRLAGRIGRAGVGRLRVTASATNSW